MNNLFMVYFSPAGSTRHVAKIIEKRFLTLGAEVSSYDLAAYGSEVAATISQEMEASNGRSCLFIGSPVYVSHAVPVVMECIAGLKENSGVFFRKALYTDIFVTENYILAVQNRMVRSGIRIPNG